MKPPAARTVSQSLRAWLPVLVACLLGCCASPQEIVLAQGMTLQEAARLGGQLTTTFSYRMNGRKYDLVSFGNSRSQAVFRDRRVYAVMDPEAAADWDRDLAGWLNAEEMPFAKGLGEVHAWVEARHHALTNPRPSAATKAGGKPRQIAEAAAAGVILAPIAPILVAGGVVGAAEHSMTGNDRRRAQEVNDKLAASDLSYAAFLAELSAPEFEAVKGAYRIREHLVTRGSFFTWNDFFYDVGIRNGRVDWVSYQSMPVRMKTFQYFRTHSPAAGGRT